MYGISMRTNPQSGSASSSSGEGSAASRMSQKSLPPLFVYMEMGDWVRATERAKHHPREVKTWASIRSKSSAEDDKISGAKRLALHHACFKLRSSVASVPSDSGSTTSFFGTDGADDPFIEVCKFILLLLEIYPEAAGMRESRHGCLPLHLAAFASCTLNNSSQGSPNTQQQQREQTSPFSLSSLSSALPTFETLTGGISRPAAVTNHGRSQSEASAATTMTAGFAEEFYTGTQTQYQQGSQRLSPKEQAPAMSVSMGPNILISEKREEMAVKVLNSLLDAFPKGIRMDSEGGRLPLHTACAGRATPRVVSTLITAYPAAARHRNKDGFLPLHLSAHWGISHPNVATSLLKAYPDATFGRNRWERTPLEEALCMAGENGRPHQSSLVRSLRKHPSYWTRPEHFMKDERKKGHQIVDIDDFEDDSTLSEEFLGSFENGRRKNKPVSPATSDLQTLIQHQDWGSVIAKLRKSPLDAEEEFKVTTRGGFTSTFGFTALHYACERRPPPEVVEALIAACPSAVAKRAMPGGALPIHIACTWHAPVSVVNILLSADRSSCKVQDELGNLALHSAAFSGTSTAVVERLLRAYPKATLARNHQGSLPEEISKRLRHENRKTVIALLHMSKEEVLNKRNEKNHRRHASDGFLRSVNTPYSTKGREGPPVNYPNEGGENYSCQQQGVEVAYAKEENELVWI